MKKIITLIISLFSIIGFSWLALFIISSLYSPQADHVPFLNDHRVISPEIENQRPLFRKYAKANDLEPYTDLIMAVAMQESKGKSSDIMQASESLGLPKDSIEDPEKSIEVGTRYFKKSMDKADGNIPLALQSYNFGLGFTDYVRHHGGRFSKELAEQFSDSKARELGWKKYGDPNYAEHVLRYYQNEKIKRSGEAKSGESE
ncbi:lysozyme family protein [Sporolactobacillus sp. Y61]|jgi:soluble lytic murein transglycosylase-like protein|uniref:Lysozyme family protein n=1 Tax=Sporolactobacillus sp. Y61 TaxID=3160863 RepID=A0AAU8ICA3_9BACL|nr:lysozyme family protein [Sporolactobacillus sp. THM19-2]RYL91492.1 cell wall hydrolase [Sporolactobacillus sp. THM19-2]